MLELGEGDDLREHTVRVGDDVMVTLPENPSTGFRWTLSTSGDDVLALESDAYSASGVTPGKPGTRAFQLRAAAPGTVEIQLRRRRRWETAGGQPEASFRVRVEP